MHWTYSEILDPDGDLEQGDILTCTPELKEILSEIHPHFTNEKYIAFSILTQSCDLVRRNGAMPKAHYVSIAAIRSMTDMFPRLLARISKPVIHGVFRESSKNQAKELGLSTELCI